MYKKGEVAQAKRGDHMQCRLDVMSVGKLTLFVIKAARGNYRSLGMLL